MLAMEMSSQLVARLLQLVERCERPNPISPRDGSGLRLVSKNERVAHDELQELLRCALQAPLFSTGADLAAVRKTLECERTVRGHPADLAAYRGRAPACSVWRLAAAAAAQAYSALERHTDAALHMQMAVESAESYPWPCPLPSPAPLHQQPLPHQQPAHQPATTCLPHSPSPALDVAAPYRAALQLLLPNLDPAAAAALTGHPTLPAAYPTPANTQGHGDQPGGNQGLGPQQAQQGLPAALRQWQEEERVQALPAILRPVKEGDYYRGWMRRRIAAALGLAPPLGEEERDGPGLALDQVLPEGVTDALLGLGADDLDLMVTQPVALKAQGVAELLGVWYMGGAAGLSSHRITPPTWEEVQLLSSSSSSASLQLPPSYPSASPQLAEEGDVSELRRVGQQAAAQALLLAGQACAAGRVATATELLLLPPPTSGWQAQLLHMFRPPGRGDVAEGASTAPVAACSDPAGLPAAGLTQCDPVTEAPCGMPPGDQDLLALL
ncbi:hypothetical protein QJQ45_017952 [Haematococcus lacustris]|nr:hypothetical protein QJQ45_017952 [Haematococcus lacustris]